MVPSSGSGELMLLISPIVPSVSFQNDLPLSVGGEDQLTLTSHRSLSPVQFVRADGGLLVLESLGGLLHLQSENWLQTLSCRWSDGRRSGCVLAGWVQAEWPLRLSLLTAWTWISAVTTAGIVGKLVMMMMRMMMTLPRRLRLKHRVATPIEKPLFETGISCPFPNIVLSWTAAMEMEAGAERFSYTHIVLFLCLTTADSNSNPFEFFFFFFLLVSF